MPTSVARAPDARELRIRAWGECLANPQATLVERYSAMKSLRRAEEPLAAEMLSKFLINVVEPAPAANALLQHEAAHCLGQRKNPEALACLFTLVRDVRHDPVVRHEAAESLSVLCEIPGVDMDAIEMLLKKYEHCDVVELAETCQIGLRLIAWFRDEGSSHSHSPLMREDFSDSRDPVPSFNLKQRGTVVDLESLMMDPRILLFTRYRALFSLRDCALESRGDTKRLDEIARVIAKGLKAPGSALLRHEVAFVLDKLKLPAVIPELARCVSDRTENPSVRHEAADALGKAFRKLQKIDQLKKGRDTNVLTQVALSALKQGLADQTCLVRDSCALAMKLSDYVATK